MLGQTIDLGFQCVEGHLGRQVIAIDIQQAAYRRRRQVALQLQVARGNGLTDEQALQQHGAGLEYLVLQQGDGTVAHAAGQHQIHAALQHGVFPGDELHVLAGQGGMPVVGDGNAFIVTQREATIEHPLAGPQYQGVVRVVFAVDAEDIEQPLHVHGQLEVVVLPVNGVDHALGIAGMATGVQLQQAVTTTMQLILQLGTGLDGLVDQLLPFGGRRVVQLAQQRGTEAVLQRVASRCGGAERVQCLVIPFEQVLLRRVFQVGYVQLNGVLLADAVQATDTLFQQIRMGRQIEHHQMMSELKVATFTADLRTDHHLGTELLVGEEGCGTVALDDAHAFVEYGGRNAAAHAQCIIQVQRSFSVGSDHQHFAVLEHFQGIDQPVDPRVILPPGGFLGLELILQADFRIQCIAAFQMVIQGRAGQRIGVQLTFREATDDRAGIAIQHPARAMAIKQLTDQAATGFLCGGLVSAVQALDQGYGAVTQPGNQRFAVAVGQLTGVQQALHGIGDGLIAGVFFAECLEVMEAIWVQQAQAGKVAGLTQLFRGGCQQQYRRRLRGQLFYQYVFRAGAFFVPDQVVGFVDHQHVPVTGLQPVCRLGVLQQELQ